MKRWYECQSCGQELNLDDKDVVPVFEEPKSRRVHTGDLFYYRKCPCGKCEMVMYLHGGTGPWTPD